MEKIGDKKLVGLLLAIIGLTGLLNCTKKAVFVNPPTQLKIQIVKNEKGVDVPVINTVVGIFADSSTYFQSTYNYNFSRASYTQTTDANGFVTFDSVSSDVRYYVLCKNDVITASDTITWSNININYQFLNPLKENTITTAKVYITASDGFVNFYTKNSFVVNNPIYVLLGKDTLAKVVAPYNLATGANGVKLKLRAGIYTFEGKSAFGCAWIGRYQVTPSQTTDVELVTCNLAKLTIGIDPNAGVTNAFYPALVVLNSSDTVGTLVYDIVKSTNLCDVKGSISITRPEGKYSYQIIGANNKVKTGVKILNASTNLACDTLILNK